jgi:dolichyl-diphosphooligosaccharide--protein glycosyltransferase
MSDRSRSPETDGTSVVGVFEAWYHVPALLALVVAMFAIRLQPWGKFIRDGQVYFSGNDAWYHLRMVEYTVANWPATMPFDPWTYFPYGTSVGQFGTLYDQLVATAALVVGLGDPSAELTARVLLVAPAAFGALTAVPAYLIGKRFGGRVGGLFAAAILALLPGLFLRRTVVGVSDHNGAEPLFMGLAVAALLVAFAVAEEELPVWELVAERDLDGLRRPLLWSAVAGVAVAMYMWVWPPGVLLVGVVGVFLLLQITADVVSGDTPEPVALVGAATMLVTGVVMLVPLQVMTFVPTQFSLLQPALAFAVAAGAGFLAWLARTWEARDVDPSLYPVAVFGLLAVGLGLLYLLAGSVFGVIERNLVRTVGFSAGAQTRTIGEAQPFLSPSTLRQQFVTPTGRILLEYGFTFFTAAAATVWLLAKPLVRSEESRKIGYVVGALAVLGVLFLIPSVHRGVAGAVGVNEQLFALGVVAALFAGSALLGDYSAEQLLLLTWAGFVAAAAFTQIRFNYYLALPVVALNAYLVGEVLDYLDLRGSTPLTDLRGYQVLAVLAVLMLVLAPVLVVPMEVRNTGNPQVDRSSTAWEVSDQFGPGDVTNWDPSLRWMSENTPYEGEYGGADNAMAYYGTYAEGDGDFDYPEGAYGVMSWWDYGHWITTRGERIPNANPFQQGATTAANFLLAPEEARSERVLAEQSSGDEPTRYVMVDWKMVTGGTPNSKLNAPAVFYDDENLSGGDLSRRVYSADLGNSFTHYKQRYYESMMVRLYRYHGSAQSPQPVVVDWERTPAETGGGQQVTVNTAPQGNESLIKPFDSMAEAEAYAEEDGTAQVGGIGPDPAAYVPALEHYRLVKMSNASAYESQAYQRGLVGLSRVTGIPPQFMGGTTPSWVKTFERVPGATVEGAGAPANATVQVSVPMESTTTGSTFTYRTRAQADENGEFEVTLPYSTTDYDEYGVEEGYTNTSVRAAAPYTFNVSETTAENGSLVGYEASVSVSEGRVVGAVEEPKRVSLERNVRQPPAEGNETDGNETADNTTDVDAPDLATGGADDRTAGSVDPAPSPRDGGERRAVEPRLARAIR